MTARVNLLPQTSRAAAAAARQRGFAIGLVVLVLVGLGLATWWQRGVLSDAEDELVVAQQELAAAEAEVAELAAYVDLEAGLAETDTVLRAAMGDEPTLAGILQDIALVTPADGALRSLAINLAGEGAEGTGVGALNAQAEVLESHAPGVERFLLQLERPAGFRNVLPRGSTIDEDDIATFPVTVQLGPEYRTERYRDGLPEVLR